MAEVVEDADADNASVRVNDAYQVRYVQADEQFGEATDLPLTLGCATVVCP